MKEALSDMSVGVAGLWTEILPMAKDLILALLIFIIGIIIIKIIKKSLKKSLITKSKRIDKSLAAFLVSAIDVLLKVILIISIIATLGVETSSVVTLFGAASVTIGFALQGSLSNFAGGIIILAQTQDCRRYECVFDHP